MSVLGKIVSQLENGGPSVMTGDYDFTNDVYFEYIFTLPSPSIFTQKKTNLITTPFESTFSLTVNGKQYTQDTLTDGINTTPNAGWGALIIRRNEAEKTISISQGIHGKKPDEDNGTIAITDISIDGQSYPDETINTSVKIIEGPQSSYDDTYLLTTKFGAQIVSYLVGITNEYHEEINNLQDLLQKQIKNCFDLIQQNHHA